jgi:predicted HTH transcriptional regulator
MANPDYQRPNRVDSVTAERELRGLVQAALVRQQGAKRWTHYTLMASPRLPTPPESDEQKILTRVREKGSINNRECQELLGQDLQKCSRVLKSMRRRGLLTSTGERRWTRYQLP